MRNIFIIAVVIVLGVGVYMLISKRNSMVTDEINSIPSMEKSLVTVYPISHASAVLNWDGEAIYMDPVGKVDDLSKLKLAEPVIILITDIHGDHLSVDMLSAIVRDNTILVAPKAVADMLTPALLAKTIVLANGEKTIQKSFSIEAIPMYNLPEDPKSPHTKGRGNGYVIEKGGKRVYVAGDTAGIPEMRALKNIDMAFVPMNLPYTMSVEEASSAVLDFAPKQVYPYHYRGKDGLSDVNKFKQWVNAVNPNIDVQLLNWYP